MGIIILLFIAWRVWITVFAMLAIEFVPLRGPHLLGGSFSSYITNPLFWAWANFDGEHYLAIAQHGYERLTHSFFPVYPLLVRVLTIPFGLSLSNIMWSGLIISNIFFLLSLIVLSKIVALDYPKNVARLVIILLLSFPTSFFFGSFYTESLFLFLMVSSFYCARKGNWWLAGILGGVASGVRVVGIILLPALLLEWWYQAKIKSEKLKVKNLLFLLLVPSGLLAYMVFLFFTSGSAFSFYTELSAFGVQREGNFVLLPQVFYRYIKMLLGVGPTDAIYFTIVVEFVSGLLGVLLLLFSFIKKIRLSYMAFALAAFILPTFTGSFSSMPRYFLVIFPFFITLALVSFKSRAGLLLVLAIFALLLAAETMFFVRGYWVG